MTIGASPDMQQINCDCTGNSFLLQPKRIVSFLKSCWSPLNFAAIFEKNREQHVSSLRIKKAYNSTEVLTFSSFPIFIVYFITRRSQRETFKNEQLRSFKCRTVIKNISVVFMKIL